MEQKFARALNFLIGGAFSALITVVTACFVYTFAETGFEYGKNLAESMTAEKPPLDVEIVLEDGATIDDAARQLKAKGVIENALFFRLESILKGSDDAFEGGTFIVNTSMDSNEINAALRRAAETSTDVRITIMEGYSIANIADYLENKEIVTAEEFIQACGAGGFEYKFLENVPERENRLEGYLFPDTYLISPNADADEIINKMLTRFGEIYDAECKARAEELGLTMDEVVIMASIIEKEVKIPEERAKVSAVIRNRLAADMPLQMCSTVVYVLDKPKNRLTEADLKVKSPYNTYVNAGLPQGPVGNPGQACILAALNPEDSDVLYFVLTDDEEGSHLFTSDYNEFTEAKELYNQVY